MRHSRHRTRSFLHVRTAWRPRACVRRDVTLRVDYASTDGQGWQGLIRNLSLQGMYIDTVSCQVTPALTPGDRLTVAFVLRPCKLRALVIHGGRHGWGVQFLEGYPQSFAHLASYWSAAEKKQTL
jgi:PilZ domain-containing protein